MLKVGLTGGIGSGKSTVAEIFKTLGIPVFNADVEAKLIMEKDEKLVEAISAAFGGESYRDKKLNRSYLAGLVFKDAGKLRQLNELVHPATINAANNWMLLQQAPYVIKEAALLFEAGSAACLDYIVGVYAPQHLRMKRVIDRDHISREQVVERINRQIDETVKMKLCDFVLINDEQSLLIPQVLKLHEKLLLLLPH